jgi:hypothetical protein
MQFLFLLKEIPNVIWSGMIASVITLSGVMLSNRSNTKRLLRQLSHDALEKEKERSAGMRRDVYLKATEEMARVGAYFGSLPQLDPVKDNLGDGLKDFLSASAKVQLVAETETATLVGELTTRYGEIFLTLLARVQTVHGLKIDIDIANDFYNRNRAEVERTLSEIKQINESGRSDPERFSALQRSFEHSQSLTKDFAEQRQSFYEQHGKAHKEFTILLMQEMRTVGQLQVHVTAAIRKELSLKTDLVEYEARLQDNWERMDRKIGEVLARLEEG